MKGHTCVWQALSCDSERGRLSPFHVGQCQAHSWGLLDFHWHAAFIAYYSMGLHMLSWHTAVGLEENQMDVAGICRVC